jgi:hypothetical protein
MDTMPEWKSAIVNLNSSWQDCTPAGRPSSEMSYRLEKLSRRLDVVADKMFIKTVKAMEILRHCARLTDQLHAKIDTQPDSAFVLLTRLETCIDDLVRKTHEFRVKAG